MSTDAEVDELSMEKYTGDLHVECYAGYRGEEEPRRFTRGDHRVEVIEILNRWVDPQHRYYKVRGGDGNRYMLRVDETSGDWQLFCFAPS
jgi:hypothetical protein